MKERVERTQKELDQKRIVVTTWDSFTDVNRKRILSSTHKFYIIGAP